MAKLLKPNFTWEPATGLATCILSNGEDIFIGTAICAPEDEDMMSEKTGCQIALFRATIEYYLHLKNHIYKPQLKILNHLYATMIHSKKFNPKSYEAKRIRRNIYLIKNDLDTTNQMLINEKENLKNYIEEKESFYQKIRKGRNKDKNT